LLPPRAQAKRAKDKTSDDELDFEAILEQLEEVVETLEEGDAPLEQALSTFERGVRLARLGGARLDEAERRIEVLLSDEDPGQTRPLDQEPSDDD
jgi:exodeoxyribonuclease VII small subunit